MTSPQPPAPSRPTPPRRRLRQRVRRGLGYGLLALAVLLAAVPVGAAFWARSDARLTAAAQAGLHASVGPQLTLGRLHWAPPLTLCAEEVALWPPAGGAPALRAHTLAVRLALPSFRELRAHAVTVPEVRVTGLEAWSHPGADDGVEAAAATLAGADEAPEPSAWTVRLEALALDGARFSGVAPAAAQPAEGAAGGHGPAAGAAARGGPFWAVEGGTARAALELGAARQVVRELSVGATQVVAWLPPVGEGTAQTPARSVRLDGLALAAAEVFADAAPPEPAAAAHAQEADTSEGQALPALVVRQASLALPGAALYAQGALRPTEAGGETLAAEAQWTLDADASWLRELLPPLREARAPEGTVGGQLALTATHARDVAWPAGTGALQFRLCPAGPAGSGAAGVTLQGAALDAAWTPGGPATARVWLGTDAARVDGSLSAWVEPRTGAIGRHVARLEITQLKTAAWLRAAQRLGAQGLTDAVRPLRPGLPDVVALEASASGPALYPRPDTHFAVRLATSAAGVAPGAASDALLAQLLPWGLRATGGLTREKVDLDDVELHLGRGALALALRLHGRLPADADAPWALSAALDGRGLGHLARAAKSPVGARKFALQAELRGSRRTPEAALALQLFGVTQGDRTLGELRAAVGLDDGVLTLQQATLHGPYGNVRARGMASVLDAAGQLRQDGPVHLELNVGKLSLRLYDGATATVRGTALVGGTLSRPEVSAWTTLTPSVLGAAAATSLPLPQVVALAEADADAVHLRALGGTYANGGRAVAEGHYRIGDRALEAQLRARGVPLPPLGAVPIEAEQQAAAAQWLLPLGAAHEAPAIDAEVIASGHAGDAYLGTRLRALPLRLDASARVQRGGEVLGGELTATLALERLGTMVEGLRPLRPQGEVRAGLQLKGSLAAPHLEGQAQLHALGLLGEPVAGGEAQLTLRTPEDNVWRATFAPRALQGVGQAQLELRRRPANQGLEGFVVVHGLHAAAFWPPLRAAGADVTASLTARGQVGGATRSLALTLARLEARSQGGTLALARPTHLRLVGDAVELEPVVLRGSGGELCAEAALKHALDARLRGRLHLAFVAPWVPALNHASGAVELDLTARGEPSRPRPKGFVRVVEPLSLRLRGMPVEVRVHDGELALSRRALRVRGVRGEVNGGTFSAGGEVLLGRDLTPRFYALSLQGERLPLHLEPLLLESNVELALRGEGPVPNVVGRIELLSGRLLQKLELNNFRLERKGLPPTLTLAQRAPWLREMGLDVQLRSSSGLDVSVDVGLFAVRTSLETDLRLRGNPLAPQLSGKVHAMPAAPGTLRFPYAQLQLSHLLLDFEPGRARVDNPLGAELLLQAEGELPSRGEHDLADEVLVRLAGSPGALELELDLKAAGGSSADASRLAVLSRLTTGHANFLDAGGDSSSLDAALGLASSQLSAPLARFAEKKLQQALNLQLELGAEVRPGQLRVEAAKTLSRRVRVSGSYGRSATQANVVTRAQLSLTDRLRLEGQGVHDLAVAQGANADRQQSKLELKLRLFGR